MTTRTLPEIKIIETPAPETAEEPLYRVIIHNDDVTPMGFVVHVLQTIFLLPESDAAAVMLTAHYKGTAYVQTLPRREAESRIAKAHFAAVLEGYPLRFSLEPE
jgi:ATP-dependent Clp protease adaptor protein ClpS